MAPLAQGSNPVIGLTTCLCQASNRRLSGKKKSFLVKLSWQWVRAGRPHDLVGVAGCLPGLRTGDWWAGDSHVWAALAAALQDAKSRRQPSIPRIPGSSSPSCSIASNRLHVLSGSAPTKKPRCHALPCVHTLSATLTSRLCIQVPGGGHVWELGRPFTLLLPSLSKNEP